MSNFALKYQTTTKNNLTKWFSLFIKGLGCEFWAKKGPRFCDIVPLRHKVNEKWLRIHK